MLEEECRRADTVAGKQESEIVPEEEIIFFDYWNVLVKRKRVLIGTFLIPFVIVAAISLLQPRCYRGESAIISPPIPPQTILSLLGDFNDTKKDEVFINTPGAIKSVLLSIPKKPNDRVSIILQSATADVIPQAFQDLHHYICNLREFREESARINEKIDVRIEKYTEARKANRIFLNQITDLLMKRKISSIGINPADLIRKDADLSVEIMNLQREKEMAVAKGSLAPISITMQPSYVTITLNLLFTGIVSLFAGIFAIFFLEYIDRMKAREKKLKGGRA